MEDIASVAVAKPCWALIEWETADEEPSAYTVIESSRIVDIAAYEADVSNRSKQSNNGQRKRDSGLYTGKLIHVQRGRYILPATIVMISEDRKFLETELQELRVMVANNMITKSVTQMQPSRKHHLPPLMFYGGSSSHNGGMPSQQKATPPHRMYSDEHWIANKSVKRQRCESGSSITLKEDVVGSRLSTAANNNSIPTTTVQHGNEVNEEAAISFISDCSNQSESPPPVRTKVARYMRADRATSRQDAPPMTFDQQTQTTGVSSEAYGSHEAHFTRILSYLESIMAEQKSCRMESDYNRKLMHELQEKMVDQHASLADVRKQLTEMQTAQKSDGLKVKTKQNPEVIVAKVLPTYDQSCESTGTVSNGTVFSYETTNNNHIVVSGLNESAEQWVKVQSVKQIATEEGGQDHSTNSNLSWASSVQTSSNSATNAATAEVDDTKALSETTLFVEYESEIVNTIGNSSSSVVAVQDLIKEDWNDSLQESETPNKKVKQTRARNARKYSTNENPPPSEQSVPASGKVALGSNNTQVSKNALDSIRWHSYKFGTRKLLQMLFPREVLATCSLSGRPCPARMNDPCRPVKDALPQKVVSDIVEYVVRKCNVDESQVRGVITTKCADENKMLRQRTSAQKKKGAPSLKRTLGKTDVDSYNHDKENVSAEH
uniref:BEN domain-containing protein n=1 Tax=Anopheles christyi TaxID=43041 RepID=A0A182JZK3_9DIPT